MLINRPIGIFDSGLGGLTAVKELRALLPGEDLIYFGDTGRVPYGTRGNETIVKYAAQDISFLREFDIKALLCACGTVSSVALQDFSLPFPCVGVIDGAAATAAACSRGKIGVIGTSATIKSGAYEREIKKINPDYDVYSAAAPLLVPLVENHRFSEDDIVALSVVSDYITPLLEKGIDTLILGCTHFPLMEKVFAKICGDAVALINPGKIAAGIIAEKIKENGLENKGGGALSCYVSDDPDSFKKGSELFLGSELFEPVRKVEIERY